MIGTGSTTAYVLDLDGNHRKGAERDIANFAQLTRYYTMPSNVIVGQTDAKIPDQQAGYEKMMGMLLAALAGADEIALVGGLINAGISANYGQVIIDDEITGYVQRILKGIDVTEDRLAIDVIPEVGHGGNFLEHEHTLMEDIIHGR